MEKFTGPALTVDAIIEFPDDRIVLIKRKNEPFKGMWALPGGFVDVGEPIDHACIREMKEETNLDIEITGIVGVYSDPNRDPRGHTVGIAFRAKVLEGDLTGMDDAAEARLFTRDELKDLEFSFDHRDILTDADWL